MHYEIRFDMRFDSCVNTVPGGSVAPVAGTRLGVVLASVGADPNTDPEVGGAVPKTDPEPPPNTDPLALVAGDAEPESFI